MKNKKFFNLDQCHRYLVESVISFKGKPIYVYAVDSGRHSKNFQLMYYDVGDASKEKTILSDNSDIDMTPFELGLMSMKNNMTANAGMIKRVPLRQYKIGLARGNVKIDNVDPHVNARYRSRYSDLILSKELRDTVIGDYPTYKDCVKVSEKEGNALAFSRRFAVYNGQLYYKSFGVPVGSAKPSGPDLDQNCFFLKEALEEDIKNA